MNIHVVKKEKKRSWHTLIFLPDRDIPECSSDNGNCYQYNLNRVFYIKRGLGCCQFFWNAVTPSLHRPIPQRAYALLNHASASFGSTLIAFSKEFSCWL